MEDNSYSERIRRVTLLAREILPNLPEFVTVGGVKYSLLIQITETQSKAGYYSGGEALMEEFYPGRDTVAVCGGLLERFRAAFGHRPAAAAKANPKPKPKPKKKKKGKTVKRKAK